MQKATNKQTILWFRPKEIRHLWLGPTTIVTGELFLEIAQLFKCSGQTWHKRTQLYLGVLPRRNPPSEITTPEYQCARTWSWKLLKPDVCVFVCELWKLRARKNEITNFIGVKKQQWITERLTLLRTTRHSYCLPSSSSPFKILIH